MARLVLATKTLLGTTSKGPKWKGDSSRRNDGGRSAKTSKSRRDGHRRMKFRVSYSLRFFLVIATAVTVFLGYSQIRRKKILEVCDNLRKDGYDFDVPDELMDRVVWQRKPTIGNVIPRLASIGHMTSKKSLLIP